MGRREIRSPCPHASRTSHIHSTFSANHRNQGAQVIADSLLGTSDAGFDYLQAGVASKYQDAVAAIILMGDPTHVVGQPGSVGNATKNGLFARNNTNLYTSSGLATKLQSYCDANDLYCASGSSLAVHLGYVSEYGSAAVSFVVKALGGSVTSSTTSAPASTSAAVVSTSAAAVVASGATTTAATTGSVAAKSASSSASTAATGSVASGAGVGAATLGGSTPTVTSATVSFTNPGQVAYTGQPASGGRHGIERAEVAMMALGGLAVLGAWL